MSFSFLGNFRGMGGEPMNQLSGMIPGLSRPGLGQPGAPRFPGAARNLAPAPQQITPMARPQMPQAPVPGQFGSQGTPEVQNSALMKHLNNPQFTGRGGIPGGMYGGPNSVTGGLDISQLMPNRG